MKILFTKKTEKLLLSAKLTPDRLKLFLDLEPIGSHHYESSELLSIVKEFISLDLVDKGVIEDICKHLSLGEKVIERRISKGKEAEVGADGKVLWLVKKYAGEKSEKEVKVDEKGKSNFFDLHLFDNIAKDQIVGRVYPPKDGIDGVDALGQKIPAKGGKLVKPNLDKSLVLRKSADATKTYEEIVSQAEGYLIDEGEKTLVKDELIIKGDLDFRYGNIDFFGVAKVTGSVMANFSITARKGIEIAGSVEAGAKLTSLGGDIEIKGSVYGGPHSRIVTDKNFIAHVIHEVHADVLGDIVVDKEVNSCFLRSGATLTMPTATIIGGEAFIVGGIEAGTVGNEAGIKTSLHICSDIESGAAFATLLMQIESHEKALFLLKSHLGPLATNPARIVMLNADHRQKMEAVYKKFQSVEKSLQQLQEKKQELLSSAKANQVVRVNFQKKLFQGAKLFAGDICHEIKETVDGPASMDFVEGEGKFIVGPYKALEIQLKEKKENEDGK